MQPVPVHLSWYQTQLQPISSLTHLLKFERSVKCLTFAVKLGKENSLTKWFAEFKETVTVSYLGKK